MFCPGCGSENSEATRFCRSCGLTLEEVSQALQNATNPTGEHENRRSPLARGSTGWQNPVIYALLLVLLGIVLAIVGDKVVGVQELKDIGSVVSLLGVGLLGFRGVMMTVSPTHGKPRHVQSKAARNAGWSPPLLHGEPPAVTENTTRQLDVLVSRTKDDQRETKPQ
jgi:hypothetical protein